jgi:glycerol-3-phosphate acyltransferase PlsY
MNGELFYDMLKAIKSLIYADKKKEVEFVETFTFIIANFTLKSFGHIFSLFINFKAVN